MPKRARTSLPWYSWIFIEASALRWRKGGSRAAARPWKSPGNVARDPVPAGAVGALSERDGRRSRGASVDAGSAFARGEVGARQPAHQALHQLGREAAAEQESRLRRSFSGAAGQGGETALP